MPASTNGLRARSSSSGVIGLLARSLSCALSRSRNAAKLLGVVSIATRKYPWPGKLMEVLALARGE